MGKKGQKKSPKPKHDPNHRTRPELALELINLIAQWFPKDEHFVTGDSAFGGKSILSPSPFQCSSHQSRSPQGSTLQTGTSQGRKNERTGPQERGPLTWHEAMGR